MAVDSKIRRNDVVNKNDSQAPAPEASRREWIAAQLFDLLAASQHPVAGRKRAQAVDAAPAQEVPEHDVVPVKEPAPAPAPRGKPPAAAASSDVPPSARGAGKKKAPTKALAAGKTKKATKPSSRGRVLLNGSQPLTSITGIQTALLTLSPAFLDAIRGVAPKKRRSKFLFLVAFTVLAFAAAMAADPAVRGYLFAQAHSAATP